MRRLTGPAETAGGEPSGGRLGPFGAQLMRIPGPERVKSTRSRVQLRAMTRVEACAGPDSDGS